MIGKILFIEFLSLFFLSITNTIFFYFKDNLPDNLLSISSTQVELSSISYYFSSLIVFVNYFSGLWTILPFLIFSFSYLLIFSKRTLFLDTLGVFIIYGAFFFLSYGLPLNFTGIGQKYILSNLFSRENLFLIGTLFFISYFILLLPKFFKHYLFLAPSLFKKIILCCIHPKRTYNVLQLIILQQLNYFKDEFKSDLENWWIAFFKRSSLQNRESEEVERGDLDKSKTNDDSLETNINSALEEERLEATLKESEQESERSSELILITPKLPSKRIDLTNLNQSTVNKIKVKKIPLLQDNGSNQVKTIENPINHHYNDLLDDEIEYTKLRNEMVTLLKSKRIFNTDLNTLPNEEVDEDVLQLEATTYEDLNSLEEEIPDNVSDDLLPPLPLDREYQEKEEHFLQMIKCLEEKFSEFKIDAKIVNILKGPVVDTFELELGQGVRISKITSITEDLILALHGKPIRMVYPMKGKSTIGIEIPNRIRKIIKLDEILENPLFENSKERLPLPLGINTFGDISIVDLASMPHVLIAGATGSGKSVFLNTLIISLIIKNSPQKLKLILIDPKQLELALYSLLPHLILPVLTSPKQASFSLIWAIQEMERRYLILKELGVRNIEGFNAKLSSIDEETLSRIKKYYPETTLNTHTLLSYSTFENENSEQQLGDQSYIKKNRTSFNLPYIVIVVDEFADLVLGPKGKEIELSICRLAAKARASGIHLVMATQRPSVDVITGLIKSNFPTRISFRVSSGIDSRTILNSLGAEKLLGHGDMLYRNGVEMERLHSAYISEDEIIELVSKFKENGLSPSFDRLALEYLEGLEKEQNFKGYNLTELANWVDENRERDCDEAFVVREYDSSYSNHHGADRYMTPKSYLENNDKQLLNEAIKIIVEEKHISVSLLQRRLRIGFNRAALIVEKLEDIDVIGPSVGARPREIFYEKLEQYIENKI